MKSKNSAVQVETGPDKAPAFVTIEGRRVAVQEVLGERKIDLDGPESGGRRCVTVALEDGMQVELCEDLATGSWTLERVSHQRMSKSRVATLVYWIAAIIFLSAGIARLAMVGDMVGLGSVTIGGGLVLAALREQGILALPGIARYLPEFLMLVGLWLYVLVFLGV